MISLVEARLARRLRTKSRCTSSWWADIVFLLACVTLVPLAAYSSIRLSATAIVALLVCLIPPPLAGCCQLSGLPAWTA